MLAFRRSPGCLAGMPSQHCSGERPRALLREAAQTSSSHPAIGFAAVTDESDADSDYKVFSSIAHMYMRRGQVVKELTERQNRGKLTR